MSTNLIQNLAISCKYKGPTESKGSRIILSLPKWKKSRIFPYDHALNGSEEQGEHELNKLGIFPSVYLDMGNDGCIFGVSFDYMREIERAFNIWTADRHERRNGII
jgi:hypothetical protein